MPHSLRSCFICLVFAASFAPLSKASSVPFGPSAQKQAASVVKGRLVDEADGLPLPHLVVKEMTAGSERASGKTNPAGEFTLTSEEISQFKLPAGELRLHFEDGGSRLKKTNRRITVPHEGDIAVRIGPTFFLDLPSEVNIDSEALEVAVFRPRDQVGRALAQWNGTAIELRKEHYDSVNEAPWVRLPEPLEDGAHWLRIRWGDPLLEARALLPRAAGRHGPPLRMDLNPMGALDFTVEAGVIPRGQPFFLRKDSSGAGTIRSSYFARAKGDGASTLAIESLQPGSYQWQLGFDGAFASGVITTSGGKRTQVRIDASEFPQPALKTVNIPIVTSLAPDLDPSEIIGRVFPLPYGIQGSSVAHGCKVRRSQDGDGFVLEIDQLGPGSWAARVEASGPFVASPRTVSIRDGVPGDTLRILPRAPQMPIRVRCTDHRGDPAHCAFTVAYQEGAQMARAWSGSKPGEKSVTIELPKTTPSTLLIRSANYGLIRHVFDPSTDGEEIRVQLDLGHFYREVFRFYDTAGQPLAGVSVDRDGERLGVSDAYGHFWFDRAPNGRDGRFTVGSANPDLELLPPLENAFEIRSLRATSQLGIPIEMRPRP